MYINVHANQSLCCFTKLLASCNWMIIFQRRIFSWGIHTRTYCSRYFHIIQHGLRLSYGHLKRLLKRMYLRRKRSESDMQSITYCNAGWIGRLWSMFRSRKNVEEAYSFSSCTCKARYEKEICSSWTELYLGHGWVRQIETIWVYNIGYIIYMEQ